MGVVEAVAVLAVPLVLAVLPDLGVSPGLGAEDVVAFAVLLVAESADPAGMEGSTRWAAG